MSLLLWILAVILVVAGILALFRRQVLWGIVLIVVGLLVGPGSPLCPDLSSLGQERTRCAMNDR